MRYLKSIAKRILPWETYKKIKCKIKFIYRFYYFGTKFRCPICGCRFRKMLSFGTNLRPNAKCPSCFSLERHRLLWLFLKEKTNFFSDQLKILHFAPELVFDNIFKSMPNLDYITADISSEIAMVKMDITRIPQQKNTYDVILCFHVLEHIVDDRKAIRELCRVLKPGGWAILQVPIIGDKTFEDRSVVLPKKGNVFLVNITMYDNMEKITKIAWKKLGLW